MVAYDERLKGDSDWAREQGARFFMGASDVNAALKRITSRLDHLEIPYAVVGGMALFQYGYRRFTEDVDLLVSRASLKLIHEALEGRGYLPKFSGSKNLRDTKAGVAIKFLVPAEYPGDGKVKPVSFPDPENATTLIGGIRCLNLAPLVELKLASGMTAPGRLKDLADVQQLIGVLNLDEEFGRQLNPFVREKFLELVRGEGASRRFVKLLARNVLNPASDNAELEAMIHDGIEVDEILSDSKNRCLATTDPQLAAKHDMHEASEFMDG